MFERLGIGLRLSDAGKYFMDHTQKMTQQLEETVKATQRIGEKDRIWFEELALHLYNRAALTYGPIPLLPSFQVSTSRSRPIA